MSNMRLLPKRSFTFGLLVSALLVCLLVVQGTQVWGSPDVTSTSTVTTNHFSVSLSFPTSISPGQSEQISAATTATSSANIISLSIDISSYVNGQPVKLASQTILGYTTVQTGAKWQSLLTVNIPADAQPGPLIGTVTEVWQTPNYYYSSYYGTPYYYTSSYYNMPYYYTQSYPYYNTYQYNMPQRSTQNYNTYPYPLKSYPNGFTVMQTTPQQSHQQTQPQTNRPSYVYQPTYAYAYRPSYYYGSNYYEPYYVTTYYPMYSSNYAEQVTSQQTVALTYVT